MRANRHGRSIEATLNETVRPPQRLKVRHRDPPLLIVEVLAPEDTYKYLKQRSEDYQRMGVEAIWIIDPEDRTAQIHTGQGWNNVSRLTVAGTPIYLDLKEFFDDIDHPAD